MSYSTDSYVQEDTCTFPVYQRLRKLNPYAYYSLDAQKQMQQDPLLDEYKTGCSRPICHLYEDRHALLWH